MSCAIRIFLLLFLVSPVFGATIYVRDGDTGTGASWADALDAVPADGAITRGDTIFIGDGTYNSEWTLDKAASGTTTITYKKATVASHGTETGWDNAFGDGQAIFTGRINFRDDYYVLDGQTANGFKLVPTAGGDGFSFATSGQTGANCVISNWEVDGGGISDDLVYSNQAACDTNTFNDCWFHNSGDTFAFASSTPTGWIFDGCTFERNNPNSFAVDLRTGPDNWTFRYCSFIDCGGPTSIIALLSSGTAIHGNLFYETGAFVDIDHTLGVVRAGSGCGVDAVNGLFFYNNTTANLTGGSHLNITASCGTNINYVNNLVWGNDDAFALVGVDTSAPNAYFQVTPDQTGNGNIVSGIDPFIDEPGADFHITESVGPGTDLGATYETDKDGETRTTWDMGAYELAGTPPTNTPLPPTPTNTNTPTFTPTNAPTPTNTAPPGVIPLQTNKVYLRPAAGGPYGTGSGADWTNARTALPTTLARGTTYLFAGGDYTLGTINSVAAQIDAGGNQMLIVLKTATEAVHGTETGWVATFDDTPVVFTSPMTLRTTPYFVMDGSYRTDYDSGYGMKIDPTGDNIANNIRIPNTFTPTNVTLRYLELVGNGPDEPVKNGQDGIDIVSLCHFWTVQYCYIHDTGRTCMVVRNGDDWLVEYTQFEDNENAITSSGEHSEPMSIGDSGVPCDRWVIRYCIYKNTPGTGIIMHCGADWKIYGNLMYHDADLEPWNPNEKGISSGGCCGSWTDQSGQNYFCTNEQFYNNTMVGLQVKSGQNSGLNYDNGSSFFPTSIDAPLIHNNIWINCENIASSLGGGTCTDNGFFDNTGATFGTDIQTFGADPLTDIATGDFTLSLDTNDGVHLSQEFGQDAVGAARGADDIWDLGAFEFNSGGAPTATPTLTETPTPTFTGAATPTFTPTPTSIPTNTLAPTPTPLAPTATNPPVQEATVVPTNTPVVIAIPEGDLDAGISVMYRGTMFKIQIQGEKRP